MISKEEKQIIIDETVEKIIEVAKSDTTATEGAIKLMEAVQPLLNMYNKALMEVINPVNSGVIAVLVFALKTTLANVEKDMDKGDKALLSLMQESFKSIAISVPDRR